MSKRSVVRLVLLLSVMVALVLPLGVFTYNHAHADTANAGTCAGKSGYTYCVAFDATSAHGDFRWVYNSPLKDPNHYCCITVVYTLVGHIGYNVQQARYGATWMNQTILNPVLHADVYLGGTVVNDTVHYMTFDQFWDAGTDCTINPSFSFGAPWAIAFSFTWPVCGTRNVADRTLPVPYGPGHDFVEDNAGNPVHLSDVFRDTGSGPPCYGANISSTFEEPIPGGYKSSSFGSQNTRVVCLPYP
jgi:hypothetical protein